MEGGQEGRRDADTDDRYRKDENTRDRGLGGKELTEMHDLTACTRERMSW